MLNLEPRRQLARNCSWIISMFCSNRVCNVRDVRFSWSRLLDVQSFGERSRMWINQTILRASKTCFVSTFFVRGYAMLVCACSTSLANCVPLLTPNEHDCVHLHGRDREFHLAAKELSVCSIFFRQIFQSRLFQQTRESDSPMSLEPRHTVRGRS